MSKELEIIKSKGIGYTEEEYNNALSNIEEKLETLEIIKRANKNIKAGYYIDCDNPCLMILDSNGSVIDWYHLDEEKIDMVNRVLKEM